MAARKTQKRSRNWCWTLNNYDEANLPQPDDSMKYMLYGKEVGESGTPHLQGFVSFKSAKVMPKKWLPTARFAMMRGTISQATEYCRKEDLTPFEYGEKPMSSEQKGEEEQKRWKDAFEAARTGKEDDIPYDIRMRYYNTCKKIKHDHAPKPEVLNELTNKWIWGESGTGKSKFARTLFPDSTYIKNQNKWFCGYDQEECVLIDDVQPSWSGITALKNWADHYPFRAEIKGGSMFIRPKAIVVTSNYSPEQCFPAEEDLGPIRRRFNVIHYNTFYDK